MGGPKGHEGGRVVRVPAFAPWEAGAGAVRPYPAAFAEVRPTPEAYLGWVYATSAASDPTWPRGPQGGLRGDPKGVPKGGQGAQGRGRGGARVGASGLTAWQEIKGAMAAMERTLPMPPAPAEWLGPQTPGARRQAAEAKRAWARAVDARTVAIWEAGDERSRILREERLQRLGLAPQGGQGDQGAQGDPGDPGGPGGRKGLRNGAQGQGDAPEPLAGAPRGEAPQDAKRLYRASREYALDGLDLQPRKKADAWGVRRWTPPIPKRRPTTAAERDLDPIAAYVHRRRQLARLGTVRPRGVPLDAMSGFTPPPRGPLGSVGPKGPKGPRAGPQARRRPGAGPQGPYGGPKGPYEGAKSLGERGKVSPTSPWGPGGPFGPGGPGPKGSGSR